ncbi:OsmC family protein [Crocinitomicaceae bacterium CZZ-1]|uniref:OsmC family protein n=1 Tax=Taishania pollutisoli TaxID=2766479 RepID=A0A8J6TZ43_9FLAO|nr:OsmC family protein [Taishania pollutisoli]MBC9811663.1 OsmC family protein [Taishania pollutisoli]MBX2948402.1 OsmC family protein [Crocinitomicaceae bacterium]NGF75500.1 OsmC family protein [Fluviicola sp. SGL-29]
MHLNLRRLESLFVMELKNEQGITCLIDANETIGGQNKGFRPMELLAGSLAACASIDVIQILRKKRILLGCYEVHIEAKRKESVPAPFEHITLHFIFCNVISEEQLKATIELALYKYCSVNASLSDEIKIDYTYKIEE